MKRLPSPVTLTDKFIGGGWDLSRVATDLPATSHR
jgi:hypothetical protein